MNKNEENRRIRCPVCKGETDILVGYDTLLYQLPLCCPKCGKRTIISVVRFEMVVHEGDKQYIV